jgi:hypothetical protein
VRQPVRQAQISGSGVSVGLVNRPLGPFSVPLLRRILACVSKLKLGGIICGVIAGCALLFLIGGIFWENVTAVSVRFVNNTSATVTLPDCGTDIASFNPGQESSLPVASDRPGRCTVDNADQGTIIGCITMPAAVNAWTVIRLSDTHACG